MSSILVVYLRFCSRMGIEPSGKSNPGQVVAEHMKKLGYNKGPNAKVYFLRLHTSDNSVTERAEKKQKINEMDRDLAKSTGENKEQKEVSLFQL